MKKYKTELVLGTAQFGMKYGVVGRDSAIPEYEIKDILTLAWDAGIRKLDTAAAYGNIESRLGDLMQGLPFEVVSKISALPSMMSQNEASDYIYRTIQTMQYNLGTSLHGILFHQSMDLFGEQGSFFWQTADQATHASNIALGISCYDPEELIRLQQRYPIAIAQLPGNAFDQRMKHQTLNTTVLYLRSIFLQGVLLAESDRLPNTMVNITPYLKKWFEWCKKRALNPLEAALGIVKGFSEARYCVVGVDHVTHLDAIVTAWSRASAIDATELAVDDIHIIDPRRWV